VRQPGLIRRLVASRRRRGRAEERLRAAEAKYRTLVEQLPLVTYIDALTASATSLYASPQVETLLGYTVDEWLGDPEFFPKILHPDDHERVLALVDHCNNTGELFRADYRLITRDGRTVWVQDESLVVFDDDGRPLFTQGYLLDITERKEAEQRLAAEHGVARVLADAASSSEAAPLVTETVCAALGWESGTLWLLDRERDLLLPDGERAPLALGEELAGRVGERRRAGFELTPGGSAYAVPVLLGDVLLGVLEFRGSALREPDAKLARTLGVIASQLAQFIERKQSEAAVWHQALHDGLTGLPNRSLFHDRVTHALERSRRTGAPFAVLLMDLDRFKEVNDTLGHQSGDSLLRELGGRLQANLRAGDTVARLGGDEFGFLLSDVDAEGAAPLVERIERALAKPFTLQRLPLQVEASIGIAVFPEHGDTVDLLVQRSDVAMYDAKRTGRGYAIYDAARDEHTPIRLTMVSDLRRALEQRELELFYQPKIELGSGRVTSVEALLRWRHPSRGLVLPDEFIPVADRTGLMDPLTRYVIEEALKQRQEWRRAGRELAVAVNVSMRNLIDGAFPGDVLELLRKWDVPPESLELEVTEHAIEADRFRAKAVLERLGEMGLRVAIDDFGTGYSSLAYLRRLPLHEIKIDRSFVTTMTTDKDDAVIVRSAIDLARNLGLGVVAEGVETAETLAALVGLGCDSAQGYYWSRPLPAAELTAWLDERDRARDAEGNAA
jgi:diguanylate cyclase (GGDEF)-like protein/PAS domain S-box-containing protein